MRIQKGEWVRDSSNCRSKKNKSFFLCHWKNNITWRMIFWSIVLTNILELSWRIFTFWYGQQTIIMKKTKKRTDFIIDLRVWDVIQTFFFLSFLFSRARSVIRFGYCNKKKRRCNSRHEGDLFFASDELFVISIISIWFYLHTIILQLFEFPGLIFDFDWFASFFLVSPWVWIWHGTNCGD